MELVDEFLRYSPSSTPPQDDSLKSIMKSLLGAYKEDDRNEILTGLSSKICHLIPSDVNDVTVMTLDKLVFVWESFPQLRTDALTQPLIDCLINLLKLYSSHDENEHTPLLQKVLRLLISVCRPYTPALTAQLRSRLLEAKIPLIDIIFPSVKPVSVDVCALAGTALCSIVHTGGECVVDVYEKLCYDESNIRFGDIAITAGFLSVIKVISNEKVALKSSLLMSNILGFCRSGVNDYHSFSCLQKFLESKAFVSIVIANCSSRIKRLTDLLWAYCDSPVQGVSGMIASCFKCLLKLTNKHMTASRPLHSVLLDEVLPIPWNVKAKLKVLTFLMPWIDCTQLLESHSAMVMDIFQCSSAHYLSAACSSLYSALLQQLDFTTWHRLAYRQFLSVLVGQKKSIRSNMKQYWLPATVARFPEVRGLLIEELSSHNEHLPSLIAVYRACRDSVIPEECVKRALLSSNDELRGDVISLICVGSTSRRALPREEEVRLLELALPHNLNIDCPAFRHLMRASILNWLNFVVESDTFKSQLDVEHVVVRHLRWLWNLCSTSLVCGSNYQRKRTLMDLSLLIIQILNERIKKAKRSAGQGSAAAKNVVDAVRWILTGGSDLEFTEFSQKVIDICLFDSSSEIQNFGYDFLSYPVTFELQSLWASTNDYLRDNMDLWSEYITSPKASEAESGAVVYCLIVQRLKLENFMEMQIIDKLESAITSVQNDHRLITSTSHVYGYIVAISRIFSKTCYLKLLSEEELSALSFRLVHICRRAVELVLEILSTTCPNKDVSPSFEQMEEAIDNLVIDAEENGLVVGDMQEANERASAWCWLTLREACCLCGTLSFFSTTHPALLNRSTADTVRRLFYSTLTRCRHRGVIEGSCAALVQFCDAMMRNSKKTYSEIPSLILNQVLDTTIRGQRSLVSSSVTRRSGGFPLIVQSVLEAEALSKRTVLLHSVITELLESCESADTKQAPEDDTIDIPQVHAWNILKALVVDAKLIDTIRCYLAQITMICINNFSSPVWSLRNAATQLFASCSQRMIGQKTQADGSVTTSSAEFFSQYPALYSFLLDKLRNTNPSQFNPEIFPILCLISSLTPCSLVCNSSSTMEPYRVELLRYAGNPIHVVRRLTSLSIVATVETLGEMCLMAVEWTEAMFHESSANRLHSKLLTLHEMIKRLQSQSASDALVRPTLCSLRHTLWTRAVEFLMGTRCDVLRTCYLENLMLFKERHHDQEHPQSKGLEHWLTSALSAQHTQMPGESLLLVTCSRLLCLISKTNILLSMADTIQDVEIKFVLLNHIMTHCIHEGSSAPRILQNWLMDLLLSDIRTLGSAGSDYVDKVLELLVNSFRLTGLFVDLFKLDELASSLRTTSSFYFQLHLYSRNHISSRHREWPVLCGLYDASHPDKSEEQRSMVCNCLIEIVKLCDIRALHENSKTRLLDILLLLLPDECPDIRRKAGMVTAQLIKATSAKYEPSHYFNCNRISEEELSALNQMDGLNFNIAIEKVLCVLPFLMGVSESRWMDWLISIITQSLDHYRQMSADTNKVTRMFFQVELNVFYERTVLVKLVCSILLKQSRYRMIDIRRLVRTPETGSTNLHYKRVTQAYREIWSLCAELVLCAETLR